MSGKNPESFLTRESGIVLKDEDDTNAKEMNSIKVLQELSSLRINGLKAMDQSVEGLVKKCHFWKDQLEAMVEKNRLLRLEEKTLRKDYEELLEKTRSNTEVLLSLKDSEKKLTRELKDSYVGNHQLNASSYINTDLSSYRILLENDKKELIKNVKNSNDKLSKINRIHQRLQDAILQQKKTTEKNGRRFSGVLAMLMECFRRDMDRLEEVNGGLCLRDSIAERVDYLMTNGVLDYIKKSLEETSGTDNEKDDVTELSSKPSLLQTEDNELIQAEDISEDQKDSPTADDIPPEAIEIMKSQIRFEIVKKENDQLHQIYSLLINRMKKLNDLYMESNEVCNKKGCELNKVADKASEIFGIILRTRKRFMIPQRKLFDELDIKIRNQIQKNEALRRLISMFLSFNQDSQFYSDLMAEIQIFYLPFLKEKIEENNQDPGNPQENEDITN